LSKINLKKWGKIIDGLNEGDAGIIVRVVSEKGKYPCQTCWKALQERGRRLKQVGRKAPIDVWIYRRNPDTGVIELGKILKDIFGRKSPGDQ